MSDQLVEIRLLGLPVLEHERATAHLRDLRRELELIASQDADEASVPRRLQRLVADINESFRPFQQAQAARVDDAIRRGDRSIDLAYEVPPAAGPAARALSDLLDEADDYCRAGDHLLTLVSSTATVAYRRWFLGEFERQAQGAAPRRWSEGDADEPGTDLAVAASTTTARPHPPEAPASGRVVVRGSLDLVSAPTVRDELTELLTTRTQLTIDLTSCDFIDSVGVGVVVAALLRAEERGVELEVHVSPAVERVLQISGLTDRAAITVVDP